MTFLANRYCVVMPVYNHPARLKEIVSAIERYGLACYMVDDGSDIHCKRVIDEVAEENEFVKVITLPENKGKGVAVTLGLDAAERDGFTHAVQLDSDGQHSPSHLGEFIEVSKAHPKALVSGMRAYKDMPANRGRGRRLTDVLVCVSTLSRSVRDPMCGYRLYPLKETMALLSRQAVGKRMDFDTDIIMRLVWSGLKVHHVPVSVIYDESMPSHFEMIADNRRMTIMHIRLIVGMFFRLPKLLFRRAS